MVSGVPANNDPVPSYLRVATAPGSIHIEKDSEDGKVDGVSFRIVGNGVDQIVETANEGSCLVNDLRPGTYTVTELTEDQYEETIPQTVTVTSNETTTVVFQNVLKRGTLKILKTSEDDKVDNVLFTINGNGVNEKVYTNEVGEIMIPDLLPGKYTVTEQNADYYEPLESQIVTVNYDEVTEVRFHNLLKRGDLIVTKSSEDGVLEGHRFCLSGVSDSGIAIEEIAITDTTGKAYFQHIPIGSNYALEELEPDERYALPEVQKVTIQWNSETHRSFRNVLKRSGLKIVKTSENGKVAEIPFTVEGNGVQMTLRTDSNGMITLEDLLPGTYTVTEQIESYYEPQKSLVVTVSYDQMVTVDFSNVLKRGNLTVIKTAEDGLTEGVRFRLSGISESGMTIDEIAITDENGKAVFNNIPIGSDYTLEEIEVPSRYVVPAKQQIVIEWNSTTTTEVYNECKRGDLEVIKTAEDGKIEGVKLHLYGISLSGESVDMYAYTDFNGRAMFGNVLIGDTYTVEEVDLPDQYITPASQRVAITDNSVTSIQFHNERKRGDIRVVKTSEDGVIDGIRFHLYGISQSGESIDEYAVTDENGVALFEGILAGDDTEFTEENALLTAESDKDGIFIFEDVRFGKWIVKELKPAVGFLTNDEVYPIDITADGAVIEIEAVNCHVYGMVHTTKVDKDYPDNLLAGAIFEIYMDVDANKEFNEEIDTLVGEMIEYEPGLYVLEGLRFGGYFLYEKRAPINYIKDDAYHYFAIENEGDVIEVENEAGIGFTNCHMLGNIKIVKTSSDGRVEGFAFRIVGENYEAVYRTDSRGEIIISGLRSELLLLKAKLLHTREKEGLCLNTRCMF